MIIGSMIRSNVSRVFHVYISTMHAPNVAHQGGSLPPLYTWGHPNIMSPT